METRPWFWTDGAWEWPATPGLKCEWPVQYKMAALIYRQLCMFKICFKAEMTMKTKLLHLCLANLKNWTETRQKHKTMVQQQHQPCIMASHHTDTTGTKSGFNFWLLKHFFCVVTQWEINTCCCGTPIMPCCPIMPIFCCGIILGWLMPIWK